LEGSSGEGVSHLQHRLVALGFAKGTPNGEYGPATTASVKLFQAANGIEENGVASSYMQAVLYSAFALNIDGETIVTIVEETQTVESIPEEIADDVEVPPETPSGLPERLSIGSTGDEVLRLQNRLTELGYVSSITGTYDNLTSRAVTSVQTALGVEATGLASQDLLKLIYSNAVPAPSMTYHKKGIEVVPLLPGDSGDAVEDLQKRLWELGYLSQVNVEGSIGSYHEATVEAVRSLQADLGYQDPDGAASAELQCYLFSEYSEALKKEAE